MKRTIAERYGDATQATNLEVNTEERRDADYLVAAGWSRVHLGAALHRLRAEWDLAAGDYRLAQEHQKRVRRTVDHLWQDLKPQLVAGPCQGLRVIVDIEKAAADAALTAKALAMVHLKTLREATNALGGYAEYQAIRQRLALDLGQVRRVASKAMQAWLDGSCHACGGKGFTGGYLTPMVLCTECRGTAKARAFDPAKARTPADAFMQFLLAEMDRKCHRMDRSMSRRIREREPALTQEQNQDRVAAQRDVKKRIAALSSTAAQED